jgi:hypothetical protein
MVVTDAFGEWCPANQCFGAVVRALNELKVLMTALLVVLSPNFISASSGEGRFLDFYGIPSLFGGICRKKREKF